MKWIIAFIITIILCLFLFLYIILVKKEMKSIKQQLAKTKKQEYNKQISINLFDKDLSDMTIEINKCLDYQKGLKIENENDEQAMRQSISDIAHDLRTPMTVIMGNLQMVERTLEQDFDGENQDVQKIKNYINICHEKSKTLKSMVDDFFELSVLESEKIPVTLERINVTELLIQFILEQEAVIRNHDLVPEIQISEKPIFITADKELLYRMLGNMLNNIIKYAKKEFYICLEEKEDKSCNIIFSNALEEDSSLDVSHLFDRTYRGDKARHGNGAGLGLYIVKLLAQKQGAVVEARKIENQIQFIISF